MLRHCSGEVSFSIRPHPINAWPFWSTMQQQMSTVSLIPSLYILGGKQIGNLNTIQLALFPGPAQLSVASSILEAYWKRRKAGRGLGTRLVQCHKYCTTYPNQAMNIDHCANHLLVAMIMCMTTNRVCCDQLDSLEAPVRWLLTCCFKLEAHQSGMTIVSNPDYVVTEQDYNDSLTH